MNINIADTFFLIGSVNSTNTIPDVVQKSSRINQNLAQACDTNNIGIIIHRGSLNAQKQENTHWNENSKTTQESVKDNSSFIYGLVLDCSKIIILFIVIVMLGKFILRKL